MIISSISVFLGGNCKKMPLSSIIVVVTKKKMSSKKAISAMELLLISGDVLPLVLITNGLVVMGIMHRWWLSHFILVVQLYSVKVKLPTPYQPIAGIALFPYFR